MQYELGAKELEFSFRIRHDSGKPMVFAVKMKPYDNRLMVQLLKEQAGVMQQSKDDLDAWDVKGGSETAARDFFDRHKVEVKMNGTVLTDPQIDRLDGRWDFKNVVVQHGYNGITRVVPEDELAQELSIDEVLGDSTIHTKFSLVNSEGVEEQIPIDHKFDYPTAMDSLAWDRASIQQGLRQGGFRVQFNHEAISTLYNRKIGEVPGCVVDGKPCVKANKAEWVDKIPYLFKRAALGWLFSKAERALRGNA